MSFCEHCQGQRFDRSRVLRTLRRLRNDLRREGCEPATEDVVNRALKAVSALEIPHLDVEEDEFDEVVH